MPTAPITLQTPLKELHMIGKVYAQRLKKLNLLKVEDLLHHYPTRYENYSLISPINQVQAGEIVTIKGQIVSIQNIYSKQGKPLQKAIVADNSGALEVVWFNQAFLAKTLSPGTTLALAGKGEYFLGKISLISPEYEIIKSNSPQGLIHVGRIVPIYPETAGVSSKWLRSRIAPLLYKIPLNFDDWLPIKIRQNYQLLNLNAAIKQIHFPSTLDLAQQAKKRLAFDELLLLHLQTLTRKKIWQKQKTKKRFIIDQAKIKTFIKNLPFQLTPDQQQAVQDILKDFKLSKPMNRLLQGDVGSGKTVIAAIACYAAFLNKQKTAFMVPTSILADQHFKTLKQLLQPYGVKIGFFTGSRKSKSDNVDLFLGTHALLYKQFDWQKLGLVIVDEQHRFGVSQRATLLKQTTTPHLLTMTATPIPRTVALTLYGDLNLSLIETLPKGRKPVKTWVIPKNKRPAAYKWISQQIDQNNSQVFIVCPLIEESTSERMANVKAATQEFNHLQKIFSPHRLALLHGRMKAQEKQTSMQAMTKGKINILVTTPVVEVGIDIPRATIILIETAERFGLAQLHQLRGRVGRGEQQAYCFLFSEVDRPENLKRLKAMERYCSGTKLAELDLELRGPGEIYGTSQSGFLNLKIASFADTQLIAQTKQAAESLYQKRQHYPQLQEKLKKITIRDVKPN